MLEIKTLTSAHIRTRLLELIGTSKLNDHLDTEGVWRGQLIYDQDYSKLIFSIGEWQNCDLAITLSFRRRGISARWLLKDILVIEGHSQAIFIKTFASESRTMQITVSIVDGLVETSMPAENQD